MSIRQKSIALLLFIGLVPTLVVSIVAFGTISAEIDKRTSSQLESIAIKQQQTINNLLQSKQEEVIKLTNNVDFQTTLGRYLVTRNPANHEAVKAIVNAKLPQIQGIQMIHVSTLDGTVLVSTKADREGSKLKNMPTLDASAEGPVIDIKEDVRGLERLYISTNVQINKRETAVMQMVFKTDNLYAAVQDYTGLGSTGETMVLAADDKGNMVSLTPLRFKEAGEDRAPYSTVNGKIIDYRGHEAMVSSRPIGFSNWTLATKIDTLEALAPITRLRDSLLWIFIVSSIVITLLAIYLTRVLTSPILLLARAAERIGKGDFDARVDILRQDEIGTLAGSINAMGTSLKSFVSGIEAQRNHLAVILNSTNDTIIAVKTGLITTANQPAMALTARPVSELAGQSFSDIFKLYSDGKPFDLPLGTPGTNTYPNIEFVNADGSRHFLKLIVATLDGHQPEMQQTIITIHDETKSRELENMKVDFVSMAAHELRTPLAAIRGYLELIRFKLKDVPPEINNYLDGSLRSAVELGGLINNLLDVSRIERGTLTLNMVRTDLAEIMARALKDVNFTAKDKTVKLNYHGPHDGFWVAADEIALKEVITNLLTNAVKYTSQGGSVDAYVEQQGNQYQVSVKDTGIGIPKDAQSHLFTKFFRVKGGLASGSSGTGLGLFIAKSILERHGGTIKAESQVGKGSTFTFTIPVLTPDRLASIEAEEQSKEATTRRHRGWITKNTTR